MPVREPVVALDANALMMPVELGVRVFDELDRLLGDAELVTPRAVVDEVTALAGAGAGTGTGSRGARAARVGSDLAAERCRVIEPEAYDAEDADDALVDLARGGELDYVVTNDRPLRDRLLSVGVPVIGVRGRNTLAITRP